MGCSTHGSARPDRFLPSALGLCVAAPATPAVSMGRPLTCAVRRRQRNGAGRTAQRALRPLIVNVAQCRLLLVGPQRRCGSSARAYHHRWPPVDVTRSGFAPRRTQPLQRRLLPKPLPCAGLGRRCRAPEVGTEWRGHPTVLPRAGQHEHDTDEQHDHGHKPQHGERCRCSPTAPLPGGRVPRSACR